MSTPTSRQRENGSAIDAFLVAHPPPLTGEHGGYTAAELGGAIGRSETWVRRNIRFATRAQAEDGSRPTWRRYQGAPSGGPLYAAIRVYTLAPGTD